VPVAIALIVVFCALGLVHVYWALGGRALKAAAIPHLEGRRAFNPSGLATFGVAIALLLAALLVALDADMLALSRPLPRGPINTFVYLLAFVFFARAVGDFRLVGFFKRVHGSPFARLDTLVFSPLCLAIAAGVFYVGWTFST
jgi:hypothetical protein